MKKIISITLLVLSLNSCASFKKQVELAGQKEAPFTVDLRSAKVPAGETGAQFDSSVPLMPIRKIDVSVIYFPDEDAVCLQYKLSPNTFYQFWDKDGRDAFVKALDKYNEDFQDKNLRNSISGRTKSRYGTTDGYLIWQSGSFGVQAKGNMDMEFGYYFREKAPFFTVTQGEVQFENYLAGEEEEKLMISGERPMFFTRSQAAEVAAFFDQGFLDSITPELQPLFERTVREVEFDSY